jgi:hypothetical protein
MMKQTLTEQAYEDCVKAAKANRGDPQYECSLGGGAQTPNDPQQQNPVTQKFLITAGVARSGMPGRDDDAKDHGSVRRRRYRICLLGWRW